MSPWLQPWKKVKDYYAKRLAECRELERLAKLCGRKLTPRKQ